MRLYPATENIPKPLVILGEKPILWHIMKYYSHFGHKDFVLCLGYRGEQIKRFFLDCDECLSNASGRRRLLRRNIEDWRVTFVDTGLNANIGQRLKAVQKYLEGEEAFLANYSDGLTDLHLPKLIDFFDKQEKTACFLSVRPFHTFHVVSTNADGSVKSFRPIGQTDTRINGGFYVFRNEIFDYIRDGEDLVDEPFQRLIEKRELIAYKYNGFWANIDTYKDKQRLDELAVNDKTPWEIWKSQRIDTLFGGKKCSSSLGNTEASRFCV